MVLQTQIFSNSHFPDVNAAMGDFASWAIFGEAGRFDKFCTMAVTDRAEVIAAIVYHNYEPDFGTVEMSAGASTRRWMSKAVLSDILDFPFDKLDCRCIVARHDEDATHLRRMWASVGAEEHIIPHVRAGKGEAVSVLTHEAWLASKFKRH